MLDNKPFTMTCAGCGKDFVLSQEALVERPRDNVSGHQNVVETLMVCSHCSREDHAYFMTAKLVRFRTTLQVRQKELHTLKTQRALKQWRRAKKRHQVEFDRVQAQLRPLFGLESPTAVLEGQGGS